MGLYSERMSRIDLVLGSVANHPLWRDPEDSAGALMKIKHLSGPEYRSVVAIDKFKENAEFGSSLLLHEIGHAYDLMHEQDYGKRISETTEFLTVHNATKWYGYFDESRFGESPRESFAEMFGRYFSGIHGKNFRASYKNFYEFFSSNEKFKSDR